VTNLDAALALAGLGWPVFPIVEGTKAPRTASGFKDASTNARQIRRWWDDHPDDSIAVRTGQESGVFVLDVDVADGKTGDEALAELEAEHGPLPATVEAITGSGGRHIYLRWRDGITNARGRLPDGIDVRGEGGYVLAPPSLHPSGGQYQWEATCSPFDGVTVAEPPAWLLTLLADAPPTRRDAAAQVPRAVERVGDRPGDRFTAETTWAELLEADGWTLHHRNGDGEEHWTRPGKDRREGPSATVNYLGSDMLKVFTSSVPALPQDQTFDRFGYYAFTRHGGKWTDAASELAGLQTRDAIGWARAMAAKADLETPPLPTRPVVVVNGRNLDELAAEVLGHLDAANDPPQLFVRAGRVTRCRADENLSPLLEHLDAEHLRYHAVQAMHFVRVNKDGERSKGSPPIDLMRTILAQPGWSFPPLMGVTETPILRPDGVFRTIHGYDPATRLYHWAPVGQPIHIPEHPTLDEVTAAVATIEDLLCDLPWDTTADRANAWALLLTNLVRPVIPGPVPMALIDAPEPGTGKSLLVELISMVVTGRATGMQHIPERHEELQKLITSLLISGVTTIAFDNVEGTLRSSVLATALTADQWQDRILGRSERVSVPARVTWMATGNNIDVGGDLARRCYRIRLDAHQAQPWKRTGFRHPDLLGHVRAQRVEILGALCMLVRSWWSAGRPRAASVAAMGGYTPWVATVGGILAHVGISDFLDNLDAFHATADHEAAGWEAFLTAWMDTYGPDRSVTSPQIYQTMDNDTNHPLKASLPDELAEHWGATGFTRRLGRALVKKAGRHYGDDGLHIVTMPPGRDRLVRYTVAIRDIGASCEDGALGLDPSTRDDAIHREYRESPPISAVCENGETKSTEGPKVTRETTQLAPRPQRKPRPQTPTGDLTA